MKRINTGNGGHSSQGWRTGCVRKGLSEEMTSDPRTQGLEGLCHAQDWGIGFWKGDIARAQVPRQEIARHLRKKGPWVVQSVKHWTHGFASGHDLRVLR